MGLLSKLTGGPDKKLLQTGLLGRGIITEVRPTGTTLGGRSAAEILATGQPGQGVIVAFSPLGKVNKEGVDIYAYRLTVIPNGADPYQIQVGNPTPYAALPFLFPGSRVPVKIGAEPNDVVIDWKAAASQPGLGAG